MSSELAPPPTSSLQGDRRLFARWLFGLLAVKLMALWLIYHLWFSTPLPADQRISWLRQTVYSTPMPPESRVGVPDHDR